MSTRHGEALLPAVRTSARPLAQFLRFIISGGLTAVVDIGALALLLELRVLRPVATSAAFLVGALVNFILHRRFTFRSAAPWTFAQLGRFGIVLLLNMALTTGLVEVLCQGLGAPALFAKAATLPVVAVTGFLLSRRFVFPQGGGS